VSHLKYRNTNGYIIGSLKVVPLLVPEVYILDVSEELSIEGSKVAGDKRVGPILVVFDSSSWEGPGIADTSPDIQKICIDKP